MSNYRFSEVIIFSILLFLIIIISLILSSIIIHILDSKSYTNIINIYNDTKIYKNKL